ncbi:hypothetical protein [Streptomyces naganishii]|uniref:Integral membrane protein n=1 Tax=Streptomyces naganishii JCM 4654 TaxID=1306179 RepID=A0A918Y2S4_9ACTN|nr:hypothetical protein [Streptomyces naganishii]GHD88067.1 hypothetical protein GCM10010508_22610 [Streptomyces naganishii JCM 4654]
MRTARTPVAVVVAAFATIGFAAPAAVAKGGDSPGVTWDVGPGGLGNGQFPGGPGIGPGGGPGGGLGNGQFPGGPGVGGAGGFGGLGGNGQFPGGLGNGEFPGGPGIGPGGGLGNGLGNEFPGGPGIGPGGGFGNGLGNGQFPGGAGKGGEGGVGGIGGIGGIGGGGAIGGVGGVGGFGGTFPGEGHGGVPGGIRNVLVAPSVIARGGQLSIAVNGCRTGGHASSPAFSTIPLRPVGGPGEIARGIGTVRLDARPGSYEVRVNCGGRTLVRPNAFTVVGGVRGGVGGGTTTGATRADMAIGGGLLAAGVLGGAAVWLRRRGTGRRI